VARRVVLHVGLMKSGTSYLQRLFSVNRDLLAERDVLFPGKVWGSQVRGVAEVLQRKRLAVVPPPGSWQALVDELGEWSGTGVISMEFLGPAAPERIQDVVSSFPSGTVDVLVTARDLGRGVPAMWQETLKNGRSQSFGQYVADVEASRDAGRRFWREQDVAATCARWGAAVGSDRVVVVTVPPAGAPSQELWQRVASALGTDPAGLQEPGAANESLGAASAEVLRLLNTRLEDVPFSVYARRVKQQLAKGALAARRAEEPALGFVPPDWLLDRSRAMVEELRRSGVTIVGDLRDLEPVPVSGIRPEDVALGDQLTSAIAALEALVREHERSDARD
jgi:hypothetical protein